MADTAPASTSALGTREEEKLMSKEHKQILREHRDTLVENMYPDDLLNRLQSKKILTTRDVTRIKDKGTVDDQNECFLDMLIRKHDRAFHDFIAVLRETDQNHVANIIDRNGDNRRRGRQLVEEEEDEDEQDSPPRLSRKRKAAVGVQLNAHYDEDNDEDVDHLGAAARQPASKKYKSREDILTSQINDEILETSLIELRNLKQLAKNGISTSNIAARKRIIKTLTSLQRFRREVVGIYEGSVIFCVYCPTVLALDDLWNIYRSGKLQVMMQDTFVTSELKSKFGLKNLRLTITIDFSEYMRCRHFLLETVVYKAEGRHHCFQEAKDYDANKENTPDTSPEDMRLITRAQKKAYQCMTPIQRFACKKPLDENQEISDLNNSAGRSSSGVFSGSLTDLHSEINSPTSEPDSPTWNLPAYDSADDTLNRGNLTVISKQDGVT